jgi:predicted dehydrogenase
MKVALVGYGYWGKIVRRYIDESSEFSLEVIYGPKLKNEGIFNKNISAILQNEMIEAVFICTPVETHYHLCKTFLMNGKHIFCEKPTVKSMDEYLELESIAVEKRRCFFTDYIYTVSPSINLMKDLLGAVGTIRTIEARIMQFGKFYSDADVFEIIGIHMLSTLIYLFPKKNIVDVNYIQNVNTGVCIDGTINLAYDDSSIANIRCSLIYPVKERRIIIIGTEGVLIFDMCSDTSLRLMKYSGSQGEIIEETYHEWNLDESNNLFHAIHQFYEFIENKELGNLFLSKRVLSLLYR